MEVFKVEVDYPARGDDPWGPLGHRGPLDELTPLRRLRPLAASWQSLTVERWPASREADVVDFLGHFAARAEVVGELRRVLGDDAEFLPLAGVAGEPFAVWHPLRGVDPGPGTVFRRNEVSRNITWVERHSFDPAAVAGLRCFTIRQPADSAAGPEACLFDVLVPGETRRELERLGLRGIRFRRVFEG